MGLHGQGYRGAQNHAHEISREIGPDATRNTFVPMVGRLVALTLLLSHADALLLPSRSPPSRAGTIKCYTIYDADKTAARVQRCLAAKEKSGKTFDELANTLGLTNTYTCQLFLGQAQLKPDTAVKLKAALPTLTAADISAMQGAPMRGFDDEILKEPNVYRTYEAVTHYGMAIKTLINEQCGDGIMSAIDFFMDVGTTTGKLGEKRVVITFNGKFLPFIEQVAENNGCPSPRD